MNNYQSKKMKIIAIILGIALIIFIIVSTVMMTLFFAKNSYKAGKLDDNNSWKTSKNIGDIIRNKELGIIPVDEGQAIPEAVDILFLSKKMNNSSVIDWNRITVDESSIITSSAILVSNDQDYYLGSTKVYYEVKTIVNIRKLSDLFVGSEFDLGDIRMYPKDSSDQDKILEKIKSRIKVFVPDFNFNYIKTEEWKVSDGFLVLHGDQINYGGALIVHFKIIEEKEDINQIIQNKNLGLIKPAENNLPSSEGIKKALYKNNANLDMNSIKVGEITTESAVITGIGFYKNSTTVNFIIDNSVELKTVITVTSFGNVEITQKDVDENNFWNTLLFTILQNNPDVEPDYIQEKDLDANGNSKLDINSTSTTIVSKNPEIYTGEVTVTFNFYISK